MIRPAVPSDSNKVAVIHIESLPGSFLADLGFQFLIKLYTFLISNEKVWVCEEDHEIKGFVSFSYNSESMMKRFIFHAPSVLFILTKRIMIKPRYFKSILETVISPFKINQISHTIEEYKLPSGELLSISVKQNCQASGIGKQLIAVLDEYLVKKQINKYKVVAGSGLIGANMFYLKNNFVLAKQFVVHGNSVSNVYVKVII